ncbi:MAG: hypothetical protein OT643_11585 [Bacteroidetes bacterium]|jgi:hypothetical protein|nr:hypothetical protein [Bacteroidota bacterium]
MKAKNFDPAVIYIDTRAAKIPDIRKQFYHLLYRGKAKVLCP